MPLLRVPNWIELRSILLADMNDRKPPNFSILTGVMGVMGVLGVMLFMLLKAYCYVLTGV